MEERLRDVTTEVLRDHTVDPFAAGRKEKLEKHGIHSTDAHEELRTKYVTALSTLPFRAYIAFGALGSDYSELYAKLLGKLLRRRLMSADGSFVRIGFEVNPKIGPAVLQGIVDFEFSDLEQANNRRPVTKPEVLVLTKPEEPLTSVPDALLHVFCRYFSGKGGETDGLRFERLRDKYRYIVNIDTAEEFSRRHPIGA